MDHFISVIFAKQLNESKRDIVLDTMINTARVGLTEDSVEYELFESEDSSTVLRLPLAKPIKETHQQAFVEALANRLFDKGHTDFEIELSVLNENLLRQGSRGADVKALQAQLGMPAAEQDGIFGPNTERAVRTFQQSMGLQVDGIVGPQTRTAIANSQAAGAATRDAPYTPQAVPQTPTQQRAAANPQTAAPQTSPRPQARPAQTTAAPTGPTPDQRDAAATAAANRSAGQALDRGTVGTDTRIAPGTTAGGPSRLRQRQMAQANPDANDPRGPDQRNVPSTRATPVNPDANDPRNAAEFDSGARGTPTTQRSARDIWNTIKDRRDALPRGDERARLSNLMNQINVNTTPPEEAEEILAQVDAPGSAQGTTVVGRTDVPVGSVPQTQRGVARANPDANDPRAQAPFDSGSRGNPNLPEPEAMTTSPTLEIPDGENYTELPSSQTDAPVNQTTPGAAQFGGGERTFNVDTNPPSEVAPQVDTEVANGMAGTFYQAMKGGTGIGTNKGQIQGQLQRMTSADMFNATAEAYQREHGVSLFQHFYDEMSDRHINQYVKPELERLGIEMPPRNQFETVSPRPKGAFMFRERNEWDALYSRTHNRDGSLKAKTNLIESRKYDEVTYHDDDQFYEDYGVMWYNDDDIIDEAEYQGRKVKLGKPMKGDVKKFKVYVRNPKGNVVKVNFGQKGVKIKKSNPARRRSFRARHNCDNPGPRHKARYWSCRKW